MAFPFNQVGPIEIHDLFFKGDEAKLATNEHKWLLYRLVCADFYFFDTSSQYFFQKWMHILQKHWNILKISQITGNRITVNAAYAVLLKKVTFL